VKRLALVLLLELLLLLAVIAATRHQCRPDRAACAPASTK
jgi:hypothetical protein